MDSICEWIVVYQEPGSFTEKQKQKKNPKTSITQESRTPCLILLNDVEKLLTTRLGP